MLNSAVDSGETDVLLAVDEPPSRETRERKLGENRGEENSREQGKRNSPGGLSLASEASGKVSQAGREWRRTMDA